MSDDKIKDALAAIRNLPAEDQQKVLDAAKSLKSMSKEELGNLQSNAAFASCGPCDPCGPHGEIGIEPGY